MLWESGVGFAYCLLLPHASSLPCRRLFRLQRLRDPLGYCVYIPFWWTGCVSRGTIERIRNSWRICERCQCGAEPMVISKRYARERQMECKYGMALIYIQEMQPRCTNRSYEGPGVIAGCEIRLVVGTPG